MAWLLLDGGQRIGVQESRQDAARALDEAERGAGWATLVGYGEGFSPHPPVLISVRAAHVVAVAEDGWSGE